LELDGVGSRRLSNGADKLVEIRTMRSILFYETDARDADICGLAPTRFDCGCTPATEQTRTLPPSSTRSERSTPPVKVIGRCINNIDGDYFLPKRSQAAVVAAT